MAIDGVDSSLNAYLRVQAEQESAMAEYCAYCEKTAMWLVADADSADSIGACSRHLAKGCRELEAMADPDNAFLRVRSFAALTKGGQG